MSLQQDEHLPPLSGALLPTTVTTNSRNLSKLEMLRNEFRFKLLQEKEQKLRLLNKRHREEKKVTINGLIEEFSPPPTRDWHAPHASKHREMESIKSPTLGQRMQTDLLSSHSANPSHKEIELRRRQAILDNLHKKEAERKKYLTPNRKKTSIVKATKHLPPLEGQQHEDENLEDEVENSNPFSKNKAMIPKRKPLPSVKKDTEDANESNTDASDKENIGITSSTKANENRSPLQENRTSSQNSTAPSQAKTSEHSDQGDRELDPTTRISVTAKQVDEITKQLENKEAFQWIDFYDKRSKSAINTSTKLNNDQKRKRRVESAQLFSTSYREEYNTEEKEPLPNLESLRKIQHKKLEELRRNSAMTNERKAVVPEKKKSMSLSIIRKREQQIIDEIRKQQEELEQLRKQRYRQERIKRNIYAKQKNSSQKILKLRADSRNSITDKRQPINSNDENQENDSVKEATNSIEEGQPTEKEADQVSSSNKSVSIPEEFFVPSSPSSSVKPRPKPTRKPPPKQMKEDPYYANLVKNTTPMEIEMEACDICLRTFAVDRLERHREACSKSKSNHRTEYDTVKHRLKGTGMEHYYFSVQEEESQQHKRELQSGISTVKCPKCNKHFPHNSADRHIPRCRPRVASTTSTVQESVFISRN